MPLPFFNDAMLQIGQNIGQNPPPPRVEEPDITDTIRRIFSMYQPEHQATDELMRAVTTGYPQRNTPTRAQNIMGFLGGLGQGAGPAGLWNGSPVGFKGGDAKDILGAEDLIRFRPFYQEMQDWQQKIKPLETSANYERYANMNQRQLLNDQAAREIGANRATAYGQNIENRNAYMGRMAGVAEQNAESKANQVAINKWKAEHPNSVIRATADGSLIGIDPQTNVATPIMGENGKPARVTSDAEKQRLIQNRQIEVEREQGNQTRQNINLRGDQSRQTNAAKTTSGGGRFDKNAQIAKANAIVTLRPEWADYVDVKTGGINPATIGEMDDWERDELLSMLYRGNTPQRGDISLPSNQSVPFVGTRTANETAPKPNPMQDNTQQAPPPMGKIYSRAQLKPPPAGYVYIGPPGSDQVIGTVRAEDVPKLDKQRYEVKK